MSGFVLINKPVGLSSHQVVARLRKFFNTRKVGHNGTLDPFASGLLILSVGEHTKYMPYLPQSPKHYIGTLKLGEHTETWDKDSPITKTMPIPSLHHDLIVEAFSDICTMTTQEIPAYSAKRHEGRRLYEYARNLEETPKLYKPIKIETLRLISFDNHQIQFAACVSSGTYIRTIGQDIAKYLGTCGHLTQLTRTAIGHVDLTHSQELNDDLKCNTIPLDHIPAHVFNQSDIQKLCQGQILPNRNIAPGLYQLLNSESQFQGLIEVNHHSILAKRMHNPQNNK